MLATGGVFYRAQVQPTEIDPNGDCVGTGSGSNIGCDISLTFHYTGDVAFYLLSDCVADSATSCTGTYLYLGHQPFTTTETKTVHIDGIKLTEEIDKALLKGAVSDFTGCIDKHQLSSCAWAAAMAIPPDRILKLASLARDTLDAIRGAADVDRALEDAKVVDGLGDDQGVENVEGMAAKALVSIEGEDAARATLNQRLAELLRRFSLGVDPAKGHIFNVGEMQTALRVEAERGVQLARDASGDLEWYDSAGRGYDAVGNSPAQYLDVQAFTRSITNHLLKTERTGRAVSFVPVDVSTYTADQIGQIKQFISGLSAADQARVFLVGAGG
ncbi:hypothetical protein [Streptacidiphilus monticola]|uniref:Tox-REase-7 domain-containing protein n=1 Tax=Streptacidiphilus monticola TaxID=2161674 RepID=A0ABW1G876_9ACTN